MVKSSGSGLIHGTGLVVLIGYAVLALHAETSEARPWLLGATLVGWGGLAVVAGRGRDLAAHGWAILVWGVCFRLVGLGVAPSWEDDYHRYLWDGYQVRTMQNPYARPPAAYFGEGESMPLVMAEVLDQINHPELSTVYGPGAQIVFGAAAWWGLGQLAGLKLLLVGFELTGWWVLSRVVSTRIALVLWWCPLAVTEIAFAGHVDALGVAGLAVMMAVWRRGRPGWAWAGAIGAAAVKLFGVVALPFLVWRHGWRGGILAVGLLGLLYWPFWGQGVTAGSGWAAMGTHFEYNSTGYALLARWLEPVVAKIAALSLVVAFALGAGVRWRTGPRVEPPPLAAVLGVAFFLSPVFNPWYALWLLPGWALRPSAWGIGVMMAVSLTYAHGWGGSTHAVVDYAHPWWVRPLEGLVVLVAVATGVWVKRNQVVIGPRSE